MAYVAPIWKNGQAPAVDAAALQAISDAIVANQTKNTQQDTSISSLQTAVNGKSRVATGSYTGTGNYGPSYPNSITFPFAPKFVWVYAYNNNSSNNMEIQSENGCWFALMSILTPSYQTSKGMYSRSGSQYAYTKFSETTLSWYNQQSANEQLNNGSYRYYWIAFG